MGISKFGCRGVTNKVHFKKLCISYMDTKVPLKVGFFTILILKNKKRDNYSIKLKTFHFQQGCLRIKWIFIENNRNAEKKRNFFN